jgi:hypothetical protein
LIEDFGDDKDPFINEQILTHFCQLLSSPLLEFESVVIDVHPLTAALHCLLVLLHLDLPLIEFLFGMIPFPYLFGLCESENEEWQNLALAVLELISREWMPMAIPFVICDEFWKAVTTGWDGSAEGKASISSIMLHLLGAGDLELSGLTISQDLFREVAEILPLYDRESLLPLLAVTLDGIRWVQKVGGGESFRHQLLDCGFGELGQRLSEMEDSEIAERGDELSALFFG